MNFAKPVLTLAWCLLAQLVALAIAHFAFSLSGSTLLALASASISAALFARVARLTPALMLLNALAPLAAFAVISTQTNSTQAVIIGLLAGLLVLLFLPTLYSGVPYYPTHRRVYEELLKLIPADQACIFYELGCGDGRLLAFLAKHRPQAHFVGVELSPLAWCLAWLRTLPYRSRTKVLFRDLWSLDISRGDFIYAFLAPPVMERLWMKLSVESMPGAVLISNAFPFPVEATERRVFPGDARSALYVYRM